MKICKNCVHFEPMFIAQFSFNENAKCNVRKDLVNGGARDFCEVERKYPAAINKRAGGNGCGEEGLLFHEKEKPKFWRIFG